MGETDQGTHGIILSVDRHDFCNLGIAYVMTLGYDMESYETLFIDL